MSEGQSCWKDTVSWSVEVLVAVVQGEFEGGDVEGGEEGEMKGEREKGKTMVVWLAGRWGRVGWVERGMLEAKLRCGGRSRSSGTRARAVAVRPCRLGIQRPASDLQPPSCESVVQDKMGRGAMKQTRCNNAQHAVRLARGRRWRGRKCECSGQR